MYAEMQVGPPAVSIAPGVPVTHKSGNMRDLCVSDGMPRYYEPVYRGQVFTASTATSGVAPGTAIGTTAAYALQNPKGSGKNLVILSATMGYLSGTLGAGEVHYIGHLNPAGTAVSGTAITPVNCQIGNNGVGVGLAFTTATVVTGGSILRTLCSLGASLASTAVQPWQVIDEVAGLLQIIPGAAMSLQGVAAGGSSPLVVFTVMWAEVPI